ncbi:hypothetical protein G6O69_35950 [Pseudenhygromyxa sp. WMMC2535]|uniref:hypothetical protein n=1 Tax=Pseudenhygromyxa sp. WMMC2535 TaxID=2712867 RepID=UPI00155467A5|nr:hypothetical protein [Pseudenhygromyxa sp. WMMC2535]NVB43274.1 hypothetical protein [Pseudenhygromyxa sp. WMMC2535]
MKPLLELRPGQAFLRRRQGVALRDLPGFVRGQHRLPRGAGRAAEQFVHELGAEALEAEVAAVYEGAKRQLGLRRRQLARAVAEGGGNVDAPQFRFVIELELDPKDPSRALWQRRVELLVPPAQLPGGFDALFPVGCDELVIPLASSGEAEDFDEIVEQLEDFAERWGGVVEEDDSLGLAALSTRDGSRLELDLRASELSLRMLGQEGCRELLLEAERRFAEIAGPVVAALEG